jgi:hypothetical protein
MLELLVKVLILKLIPLSPPIHLCLMHPVSQFMIYLVLKYDNQDLYLASE